MEEELKNALVNRKIAYDDIFGTPQRQVEAIKVWKIIDKIWTRKLKAKKNEHSDPNQNGSQEAP